MKILAAIDGSMQSQKVLERLMNRPWPEASEVKILFVADSRIPDLPDPLLMLYASRLQQIEDEKKLGHEVLQKASGRLADWSRVSSIPVFTELLEGSAKEQIVDEAKRWEADLILIGSHGRGAGGRFFLGSVSLAVATHAHCSVEIVK